MCRYLSRGQVTGGGKLHRKKCPFLKATDKSSIHSKKRFMPMKQVFTPKKMRPSAQTIYFIKQIAYSYHTMVQNGKLKVCYPN